VTRIVLINTPTLPCPDTHYLHVKKFLKGFVQNGFPLIEVNNKREIDALTHDDIVYISNHGFEPWAGVSREDLPIQNALKQMELLEKKCHYAILWHFHQALFRFFYEPQFKNVILTGHWRGSWADEEYFDFSFTPYSQLENFVPMRFATDLHPSEIEDPLDKVYDACFIGTPYKIPWIQEIAGRHNVYAHFGKPWLPEADRLRVLRTSTIGLGFGADQNVKEGVMTERVIESIAHGCVVISDCATAPERTGGAAIYVESKQHALEEVKRILHSPEFAREKMHLGLEFVRNEGTYFHLAKDMLDALNIT